LFFVRSFSLIRLIGIFSLLEDCWLLQGRKPYANFVSPIHGCEIFGKLVERFEFSRIAPDFLGGIRQPGEDDLFEDY